MIDGIYLPATEVKAGDYIYIEGAECRVKFAGLGILGKHIRIDFIPPPDSEIYPSFSQVGLDAMVWVKRQEQQVAA